jgi:hypothetical protein
MTSERKVVTTGGSRGIDAIPGMPGINQDQYELEPAHGHNVLLGEGTRRIAGNVIAWVVGKLALGAALARSPPNRSKK